MLILKRKAGQKVLINDNCEIIIKEIHNQFVTLAFEAPRNVIILRGEVYNTPKSEGRSYVHY